MTAPPPAIRLLNQRFLADYPEEAAGVLERLPPEAAAAALTDTPGAAAVFDRLTPQAATECLAAMPDGAAVPLLQGGDPARVASVLARLDGGARDRLLAALQPALAAELATLMAYPPDTAGRLMDARVMTFRPETTVGEALARLRRAPAPRTDEVFLVDGDGRLTGLAALQDLALAAADDSLQRLARPATAAVEATAEREEVVSELSRHGAQTLPVVDFEGRVVGVLRQAAIVAAVRDEISADMQTMVGASAQERALSKVSFAVRKRLPWLEVNLLTAFLAAAVVGLFENTIARFTALAVLLPVVAGQSGNTGAQALAVTMRGLAVREIRLRHWARVSVKELGVAAVNGVAVALTTALGVYVWSRSLGLALVIALSMVLSMVGAGLAGALTPMALTRLGQDPAQSSSIILTTVTDIVGFFSFLGIATILSALL